MLSERWQREQRTMSRSRELFGVDEPLSRLDDMLALESLLELELMWPGNGRLTLDCVCSCMNDSWLMGALAIGCYLINAFHRCICTIGRIDFKGAYRLRMVCRPRNCWVGLCEVDPTVPTRCRG